MPSTGQLFFLDLPVSAQIRSTRSPSELLDELLASPMLSSVNIPLSLSAGEAKGQKSGPSVLGTFFSSASQFEGTIAVGDDGRIGLKGWLKLREPARTIIPLATILIWIFGIPFIGIAIFKFLSSSPGSADAMRYMGLLAESALIVGAATALALFMSVPNFLLTLQVRKQIIAAFIGLQ